MPATRSARWVPIYSATVAAFTLGGSRAGNLSALADAHARLLAFLAAQ